MTQFAGAGASWGFSSYMPTSGGTRSRSPGSQYVKDDSFSVRCDVTVVTEFRAEDAAAASSASAAGAHTPPSSSIVVPPSDLPRHFGDLLASEQGADVQFRVDGEDFAAHRCVLAVRSPVFRAELLGTMKEGSGVVEIEDMRADLFRNLLRFIYTDSLPEPSAWREEEEEALMMAQQLLVAADRYGMERLKVICEDTLCRHIDVGTAATTLAIAEQHRCQGLKDACVEFLRSPGAMDAVMATDGFDHLAISCPSLIKELMSKLAAR